MAVPEIDLTNNWMRIARTAAQQAMERGMDYVEAAYYVTASANPPIRLPVLRNGSLDVDACNFMFHRLVDEFRPEDRLRPSEHLRRTAMHYGQWVGDSVCGWWTHQWIVTADRSKVTCPDCLKWITAEERPSNG